MQPNYIVGHGGEARASSPRDPRWELTPTWKRIWLFCPKWQKKVYTWEGTKYHYASDKKLARIHLEQTFGSVLTVLTSTGSGQLRADAQALVQVGAVAPRALGQPRALGRLNPQTLELDPRYAEHGG